MAECNWCKEEMTDPQTKDCAGNRDVEYPDGKKLHAIKWNPDDGRLCGDCRIVEGSYHHPGCHNERCPRCEGQLIGCSCLRHPHDCFLCGERDDEGSDKDFDGFSSGDWICRKCSEKSDE